MDDLNPCPMCGERKGYTLRDGSTHRWWYVECAACGRPLDECRADRAHRYGDPLPVRWVTADTAWQDASAHAATQAAEIERLRADNARLRKDAERFVCLASHYWVQDGAFHKLDLPIGVFDSADMYMQELRAAIDSRRKERKHAE